MGFAECGNVTARRDLAEEIPVEEARLSELEQQREDSRRRLNELRAAQAGREEAETADGAMSSDSWSRERKPRSSTSSGPMAFLTPRQ